MRNRAIALSLLCLLFIVALAFPSAGTSENDCKCHDRPSLPCLRQQVTLEDVVFELRTFNASSNNAAHTDLYEAWENSEVWILIETVPSGPCAECAQTYVLYAPKRNVLPSATYSLFTSDDPTLTASRVAFLMTECSGASALAFRMAVIEQDRAYSDSLAYLAPYLSAGLLFGETGSRNESAAEKTGWSARVDGAWLNSIVDRLTVGGGNQVVLPPTAISAVAMDNNPTTADVGEKYGLLPRWVQVKLRGDSYSIGCDLRCSADDAPTRAETHLLGRKLCDVASLAATATLGFAEVTAGPSLPANVVKQSTSVKRQTIAQADGSKVEYTFFVRVIEFSDYSIYVEVYSMKRVIRPDGTVTETVRDCLQATSLRGFDRSKIRALLEVANQAGVAHTLSGGSPSAALSMSLPVDVTCGITSTPDRLTIVVPSNTTLDTTALASATTGVQAPHLLAWQSVTIHADEIVLPVGSSLASTISPTPRVLAAVDGLSLFTPEVASVARGGDRLDVVLANQSGARAVVLLDLVDDHGWVVGETREIPLSPGQAMVISIPIAVGELEALGATSLLSIAASSEGLPQVARTVDLRVVSSEAETGSPASTGALQPPPQTAVSAPMAVPEDIARAARTLAWKGGQLGRTDPSQRWDAAENDPSQFCEPCGHTPMCVVCMEWDLQEWQLHRQKSVTDIMSLMALLSYLTQVYGRPEYNAVAATYWDAHWDGWHNRERPW